VPQSARLLEVREGLRETLDKIPKHILESYCPVTPVCHYTTGAGLHGILSTGEFWASRVDYTNDPLELKFVYDQFTKTIRSPRFPHVQAYWQKLNSGLHSTGGPDKVKHETYIVSFSEIEDDLSQFRGYCNDGMGYCLRFDPKKLIETINRVVNAYTGLGGSIEWRRVIYGIEDLKPILDEVAQCCENALSDMKASGNSNLQEVAYAIGIDCHRVIYSMAAIFKQGGYSSEREVRLITHSPFLNAGVMDPKFSERIEVRMRGDLPVPYVPLGLDKSNKSSRETITDWMQKCGITKIIVGPKIDYERADSGLHYLLLNAGQTPGIEIVASTSTYR